MAFCPTLAATEAIQQYRGWRKGEDPDPPAVRQKRIAFRTAIEAGVTFCMGSDAGVFPHGDNVRELELMAEYGLLPAQALLAATAVNARILHLDDRIGTVRPADCPVRQAEARRQASAPGDG